VSDDTLTVGSGSLGVDDTLGNALTGEVGELVEEVEVLDEDGALGSNGKWVLVIVDGVALGVGDSGFLHLGLKLIKDRGYKELSTNKDSFQIN
jgi:hypothetical protein